MPVCVDPSCEVEPQREWGLGPWSFDLGSLSRGNLRSASSKGNGVSCGALHFKIQPHLRQKGEGVRLDLHVEEQLQTAKRL